MSKYLDNHTLNRMLKRIDKLAPYAKPRWGTFTVKEMMYHCTAVTNDILSENYLHEKPTRKQSLVKFIGLYVMSNFPKGVKSSDEYIKPQATTLLFITEKEKLKMIVKKVADYTEPIYGKHTYFGPMATKDWKRFLYKHLDHHLRQFGV